MSLFDSITQAANDTVSNFDPTDFFDQVVSNVEDTVGNFATGQINNATATAAAAVQVANQGKPAAPSGPAAPSTAASLAAHLPSGPQLGIGLGLVAFAVGFYYLFVRG